MRRFASKLCKCKQDVCNQYQKQKRVFKQPLAFSFWEKNFQKIFFKKSFFTKFFSENRKKFFTVPGESKNEMLAIKFI